MTNTPKSPAPPGKCVECGRQSGGTMLCASCGKAGLICWRCVDRNHTFCAPPSPPVDEPAPDDIINNRGENAEEEAARLASEPPAERRCVHGLVEHKCGLCGIGLSEPPAEPTRISISGDLDQCDGCGERFDGDAYCERCLHAAEERARKAEEVREQFRQARNGANLELSIARGTVKDRERENAALRERPERLEKIIRDVLDESGVQAHLVGCPKGMTQAHARYKRAVLFQHCAGCAAEEALAPEDGAKEGGGK